MQYPGQLKYFMKKLNPFSEEQNCKDHYLIELHHRR